MCLSLVWMLVGMKRIGIILSFVAVPALAGPIEDAARPCLIERLDTARAACLGVIADQWIAKTEGRIAVATIDLQAANAKELKAFERDLEVSQHFWRDRMESACRSDDPVAYQECRLGSALERDGVVRDVLAEARAKMGLRPVIEVPSEIEVLIPLPVPPAGPDADVRIPLVVPVQP